MWLGLGKGSMTCGQVLAQNGEITCDGWFQTGYKLWSCVFQTACFRDGAQLF